MRGANMTDPYTDTAIEQDRHHSEDFNSGLLNPLIVEPDSEESMNACVTAAPPPEPRFDSQYSAGMVDTASNARSMGSFSEGGDMCVTTNPPPGPAPDDWQHFVDGIYSDSNTSDLSASSAATHSAIPLEFLLNAENGDSALREAFYVREKSDDEEDEDDIDPYELENDLNTAFAEQQIDWAAHPSAPGLAQTTQPASASPLDTQDHEATIQLLHADTNGHLFETNTIGCGPSQGYPSTGPGNYYYPALAETPPVEFINSGIVDEWADEANAEILRTYIEAHYPGMKEIDDGILHYLPRPENDTLASPTDDTAALVLDLEQSVRLDGGGLQEFGDVTLSRTDTIAWSVLATGTNGCKEELHAWIHQSRGNMPPASLAARLVAAHTYLPSDISQHHANADNFPGEKVSLCAVYLG